MLLKLSLWQQVLVLSTQHLLLQMSSESLYVSSTLSCLMGPSHTPLRLLNDAELCPMGQMLHSHFVDFILSNCSILLSWNK